MELEGSRASSRAEVGSVEIYIDASKDCVAEMGVVVVHLLGHSI